jgi:hypothetical protein
LEYDVQSDRIDHVLNDDPEDGVGAAGLVLPRPGQGLGGLQRRLGRGRGIGVGLVSLQRGVVGELHVDGAFSQLGHAVGEVVDHRDGTRFLLHLEERLVLPLQDEHVGDPAKRDAEVDDLRLGHIVGDVPYVDHLARFDFARLALFHL